MNEKKIQHTKISAETVFTSSLLHTHTHTHTKKKKSYKTRSREAKERNRSYGASRSNGPLDNVDLLTYSVNI